MEIKKVAIIGLGALGILFGAQIAQKIGDDLTIIAPARWHFLRTVVALGQKHGIKTPVNAMLYEKRWEARGMTNAPRG